MPNYNKQNMLSKTIESTIMQKAYFAYKLVILDDGSTDDSYAIVKRYKRNFPLKSK
ncbi:glycosyltransferase family A protein [Helicobacter sp. T3_23-1059]